MEWRDRALTASAALLLVALGFFPIANWIPGGLSSPGYAPVMADLLSGAAIALGVGLLVVVLTRGLRPESPGRVRWSAAFGPGTVAAIAVLALGLYALVARVVFSGRPLLIDEIVQVFQARILADGRLSIPAAAHQEFFSSFHIVEQAGRVYGQFPVGGPAMLALGSLLGAEWLAMPVFGALGVLGFGLLVSRIEPRRGVALGATLLFALAPFAVFMSGSHMNHVPTLCWLVWGFWALSRAASAEGRFGHGMVMGLCFGLAATIRPVDALTFALPAGVWLLARALRERRVAVLLGAGLGILLPVLALLWVNLRTTGAPLRFGYTVLWGRGHDLGFHATPWGQDHTPVRGLELLNIYFLRLQSYLFEAGGPSLLPAAGALALTRTLQPFDRYLLAGSALLTASYFAYWHDGFYLGPRFLYPLLPVLVLWTARLPAALRERIGDGAVVRGVRTALAAAVVLGLLSSIPTRVQQYRSGLLSMRWDPDRAAAAAGVRDALVLVRESWGAELIARMWALGVSRPDAELTYRSADACRIELALDELERQGVRGAAVTQALAPLRADSARLVTAEEFTGDPSLRLTRGMRYPVACLRKFETNRAGFTLFAPMLLARGGGNVYARDLGARDSLLLRDFPNRPVYLLRPPSGRVGAEPRFYPLRTDSLLAAWRAEQ